MKQSSTAFTLSGRSFSIPAEFLKVRPLPDDPPGSVVFEKDTREATNILMFFFIGKGEAMPFDDWNGLIASMHNCLGENQGLLAVCTGVTAGACVPFVYTVVKSLKQPSGVQYILTFQMDFESEVLNLQGYFDEEGVTGIRDAAIYEQAMREGIISARDRSKWCADPYQPDFRFGALMNLAEQERFDDAFPSHPLSELRRFVKTFISDN